jgi:putative glycosyltransferase (TIGR04372 family)
MSILSKVKKLKHYTFWEILNAMWYDFDAHLKKAGRHICTNDHFNFLTGSFFKKTSLLSRLKNNNRPLCEESRLFYYNEINKMLENKKQDKDLLLARYHLEKDNFLQNYLTTAKRYIKAVEGNGKDDHHVVGQEVYLGALGNHHLLSSLIQSMALGYRKKKSLVVYLPKCAKLRNSVLFDYFKPYLEVKHGDKKTSASIRKDMEKNSIPFLGELIELNGEISQFEVADSFLQKKWQESGGGPLLSLSEKDRALGKEALSKLGLPAGAWYVCFHMREPGFRDGGSASENFRNVDPFTYMRAMEEVTKRGGYVFRMGDPSMTMLPKMKGVIDYAHSECRSEFMDVFLCASCQFMVGTASGVYNISRFFGAPILMTNLASSASLYSMPINSLVLLRLHQDKKTRASASMREVLSLPMYAPRSIAQCDSKDYSLLPNTVDEILTAVIEMFEKKYDRKNRSDEENKLQEKVDKLSFDASILYGNLQTEVASSISPSFLSKYKRELIDNE